MQTAAIFTQYTVLSNLSIHNVKVKWNLLIKSPVKRDHLSAKISHTYPTGGKYKIYWAKTPVCIHILESVKINANVYYIYTFSTLIYEDYR